MRRRRGLNSAIWKLLSEGWVATPMILSDRRPLHDRAASPAKAGSFNPLYEFVT
jgi:hypothetical protein